MSKPQHRQDRVPYTCRTIPNSAEGEARFGGSTVPRHELGGWALPGGGRTDCQLTALKTAMALSRIIDTEKPEIVQPVRVKPTVRRRKAEKLITFCGVV